MWICIFQKVGRKTYPTTPDKIYVGVKKSSPILEAQQLKENRLDKIAEYKIQILDRLEKWQFHRKGFSRRLRVLHKEQNGKP